ncbi:two-component system response regulator [Spirochaetia bacterium]|nr:two-component system response regulator [Spirochaetia bacterium]
MDAKALVSGKIVLVDDDVTSLALGKSILSPKYDVITIPSGEKLFIFLEKIQPDLILLDVEMPGMNGYETLKKLKANPNYAGIPVIFLTSRSDPESELEGLKLGAIDYISKPFSPPLLLKRIELHLLVLTQTKRLWEFNNNLQHMVKAKTKAVVNMQNSIVKTVANLVEYRDEITGGHIVRTRSYLEILLDAMVRKKVYLKEIEAWDRDAFFQSSQLHDVGKIFIRDNILLKPGKLTPDEFVVIKKHAAFGVQIIEEIEKDALNGLIQSANTFLTHAKIMAGTHHERWDGKGYPYGLAGETIPLEGRLMAIADVYDALISVRPYKAPLPHKQALQIIIEGTGTQFDPALVNLFRTVSDKFNYVAEQYKS